MKLTRSCSILAVLSVLAVGGATASAAVADDLVAPQKDLGSVLVGSLGVSPSSFNDVAVGDVLDVYNKYSSFGLYVQPDTGMVTMDGKDCTGTECGITSLNNKKLTVVKPGTILLKIDNGDIFSLELKPAIDPAPDAPSPTATWNPSTATITTSWAPFDWKGATPGRFAIETRYPGGPWRSVVNPSGGLAETWSGAGVAGSAREIRVQAIDGQGAASAWGTTSITPPNPGLPITATTRDAAATLAWPAVTGATTYFLSWYAWAPGTPGGTVRVDPPCPSDVCTTDLTGLTNGQEYRAHVSATLRGGTIAVTSPDASFTPQSAAPATLPRPSVALAWLNSGQSAQLDWAPYDWGTFTPQRFEIEWLANGSTNPVDNSSSPTGTQAIIQQLTAPTGSDITFRVRAQAADGTTSDWGEVRSRYQPTVPFTVNANGAVASVEVSFSRYQNSDSYRLTATNSGVSTEQTVTCATDPCVGTITGLTNGTTYSVYATALDGTGKDVATSNSVTATPQAPLVPLNAYYPTQLNLQVGIPFTPFSPTTTGGVSPYTYASGSTALPAGMYLDSATGAISGTPQLQVDGLFPIVVSDASGQSLTVPLRIVVAPHTFTLAYPDHSGHVGSSFTVTPTVSHVLGNARDFVIDTGSLPAGMSIDRSTGVISGTPTAPTSGPGVIVISARDDYATATAAFTLTIDAGTAQLSASYPNAIKHVGKNARITPTVSGSSGATTFNLTSGTLPAGLTVDPGTGVITGIPTTPQPATPVTITVTDGASSVAVTFSIEVLAHTLSLAYPSASGEIGSPISLDPVTSHIKGSASYQVVSGTLPPGMSLDPTTGVISGTPTTDTGGPVALLVTVTDQYESATAGLTITVTDPVPPAPTITASLSRDLERVTAIGNVVNAPPGATVTPMVRLTGQQNYATGRAITIGTQGSFTWSRIVAKNRAIDVYFTVGTAQTSTLGAEAPTVSVTGDRVNNRVTANGVVVNLRPGSVVQPWVKINGAKATRGYPVTVATDGTFTWTRSVGRNATIRVKFNVRGVVSSPLEFAPR